MSKKLLARLRKTIASILMVTTIVWLSGIFALATVASAATVVIKDGDLIRNPSAAGFEQFHVYIVKTVGTKKFKRLILNPTVFASYGHLKASNVKLVTQAEMDAYATSGLVRVDGDTKVFALAPTTDVGVKSWLNVSAADFLAAGADPDSVYTINSTDAGNYTAVGDVTTKAQVTTFLTSGTLPSSTPVVSGPVSAALAADTPAAGSIVRGQAVADLAHFTFSGTGTVSTVVLQRIGISSNSDLSNVYLYEGNTRLTDAGSLNTSSQVTFNMTSGLFTVSGTKTISVRADVSSTATGTAGISLVSHTVSGGVAVTDNLSGNISSIIVPSSIATVAFNTAASTSVPAQNVNAGTMNFTGWSAPITVGTRAVKLQAVSFKYIGSAATDALSNIKLFLNGNQIGSNGTINSLGYIVFDLGTAPQTLNTGTQTLDLRADIIKGSNRNFQLSIQNVGDLMVEDSQLGGVFVSATNIPTNTAAGTITINPGSVSVTVDPSLSGNITGGATNVAVAKYKFQAYGEDMKITQLVVTPTVASGVVTPVAGNPAYLNNVTLYANGGQIGTSQNYIGTALTYNLGSSLIVPAGTTATFEVHADTINNAGSTYTAGTLTVLLQGTTNNAQGLSSSNLTTAPSTTGVTSTALTLSAAAATVNVSTSLTSKNIVANSSGLKVGSYVVQSGSTEGIKITNLQVGLTFGAAAPLYASGTVTTGSQSITVSTSTVNIAVGDVITIPGATAAVGTVTSITSGTVFVVNITTAGVTPTVGGTITGTTGPMTITNVSNLKTSENSTPIAPSATNNFPVNISLAASASKTIDVFADIGSLTAGTVQTTLKITAIGATSNVTLSTGAGIATALNGQTMTVASGSVATPTLVNTSAPTQFQIGPSSPNIAVLNFIASNGDATITQLTFSDTGSNTSAVSSIAIGAVSGSNNGGNFTVSGLNILVPAGFAGTNVTVVPTYNPVGLGGQTSNLTSIVTLTGMKYTIGNATTTTTGLTVAARTMDVVATKPTVTVAKPVGAVVAVGLVEAIDVTVTADAAGILKLNSFPITATLSAGAGTPAFTTAAIVVKDSNNTTLDSTGSGTCAAAAACGTITVVLNGGYTLAAGQSQTFKVFLPVGAVGTGALPNTFMYTSLVASAAFSWTDVTGNSGAITNTTYMNNYPSTFTSVVNN